MKKIVWAMLPFVLSLNLSAAPVFQENFEKGLTGWTKSGSGFSASAKDGVKGSGCVFYNRTNPKDYSSVSRNIKLTPGKKYKLTLKYKTDFKAQGLNEFFAIRYFKNKKPSTGIFYVFPDKKMKRNWEVITRTFTVPTDVDSEAGVSLLLRTARLGTVWYDDLTIEEIKD